MLALPGSAELGYDRSDMKQTEQDFWNQRQRMVDEQLLPRGIRDQAVIRAMRSVPRERFVGEGHRSSSYDDGPLSIGFEQTISQPFIVAHMCQLLRVKETHRILEIGFGSGYLVAVLAQLAGYVTAVERVEALFNRTVTLLKEELDSGKIHLILGDGALGVPQLAPFDRIIVSASIPAAEPPPALLDQLGPGGILVAPMGSRDQHIYTFIKKEDGVERQQGIAVSFVPFVSDAY